MTNKSKKSNQNMLAGIAILVVIILVASGFFVYYEYFAKEETEEAEPTVIEIDDRISPLNENQAMILEVQRIRHRGLYDKLMTFGTSWKTKPKFYFVTELDGLEYRSKDVSGDTEVLYHTWDTMFQENKIVRDAEEEQETSTVTLAIVERVTEKRLFKTTSKDIERDKITVTYDYRTGRWTGDDYFKDKDGYGYYLGDTFEIWFNIYQVDNDYDLIPYWTEVNVLGTDPQDDDSKNDPDEDGIPTDWEWKWGYDPFTWDDHERLDPDIDGLENIEEYQMAKWLADPYTQNIYCEVDFMERASRFDPPHIIYEESQQAIIEKYAEHNIKVFFDMGWPDTPRNGGGEALPHYEAFSQDSGMILQYYNHHFPEERRGIFRYVVGLHGGPFNHPAINNVYDCLSIGYTVTPAKRIKHWLVSRIPIWDRNQRIVVAQTLMHEMGHSVGIHPWTFEGCDNRSYYQGKAAEKHYDETWGQYMSVMNYYNMYNKDLLGYSNGKNGAPYDQNDWLNLFVADFQYNCVIVEEIYFEAPGFDKIVYGETEHGVSGYVHDEELTEEFTRAMGDWSPVDPIDVNWVVFKLEDRDKYPDYREIKILVQPDVSYAEWAEYAEGELDSNGNIQIYSQQGIVDNIMDLLKSQ